MKIQFRKLISLVLALVLFSEGLPNELLLAAPPPAPVVVPTREPLIEVSVDSLEISENNSNIMGILWGDSTNPTGNQINFIESAVPALFSIGKLNRNQIAGRLDAMIQNNQVRILANPTLLTKSGFEANFLVGGEIPYPQVGQGGVAGVEYKKYGVGLKILPVLTPRQTIDAQINVSVTSPDPSVAITVNGTSVPGLSAREAGTKVEVKDGETVVMAGIKQSRKQKTIVRVPVLGYIPLLGLLFRHKDEETIQTSLVLFVTFRLVKS
jgi:pilus assembly protein CpaC